MKSKGSPNVYEEFPTQWKLIGRLYLNPKEQEKKKYLV